jgi:hypothetical protein
MATTKLLTRFDNLDDRRELYSQFAALRPIDRYRFVSWASTLAQPIGQRSPTLVMDERSREAIRLANRGDSRADGYATTETWGLLVLLTATWGVPISHIANTLESIARGRLSIHDLPNPPKKQCRSQMR